MEELIEKVDNLKQALEECEIVKEMKEAKKEIEKNQSLIEDIKKYQNTKKEELKDKIIHNEEFQQYKKKETDCNLLILEINQKLKELKGKGKGCI